MVQERGNACAAMLVLPVEEGQRFVAKEARQELAALTLGGWQRRLDEALVPHRALWAPLVALVTLALLLTVLAQAPLHALPDYPAAGVAFLVAIVLPGLVAQLGVVDDADEEDGEDDGPDGPQSPAAQEAGPGRREQR